MSLEVLEAAFAGGLLGSLAAALLARVKLPRRSTTPARHTHRWYDRPFLQDGDTDVFACRVTGCSAHMRMPSGR